MVEYNSKDIIDMVSTRDAATFTQAVNNILAQKAKVAIDDITPQVASQMFKGGYEPKSPDEQEFVDQHTIAVIDYPVPNENGAPFKASTVKADHDGRPNSGDEKDNVKEQKLSPAEMRKREKVAKGIERENPRMSMGKKMAIATSVAMKST